MSSTDPTFAPIQLPVIPEGTFVYDGIMGGISKDLTMEGLKLLDEKYKNETQEQTRVRVKQYEKDFAEFDRQYQGYTMQKYGEIRTFAKYARTTTEDFDRTKENQNVLIPLEASIADAPSLHAQS